MIRRIKKIFTIIGLTITTAYGQEYEPLDLAKKIFTKDPFPRIENYTKGEYKGKPNGQNLSNSSVTKFMLLKQTEKTAVVAMTILDSLDKGIDTYLHFEKDSIWKVIAFRTLAMTGIIQKAKTELERMTPKQVDETIAKAKKKGAFTIFASKEEYNFQLNNLKLTLELDENIIKHFITNQTEFEQLKNLALEQLKNEKLDDEISMALIKNQKANYQKLLISSVSTGSYELGNCINFLIGGITDNAVGYLYVTNKDNLPEMNPNKIIMIREIGNGWYIYKTT